MRYNDHLGLARVCAARKALLLLAAAPLVATVAHGQGTTVLHCQAVGVGGDNASFRGIRFQVDQSFTSVELHIDGSTGGMYSFDVELRRSMGYVAPVEAFASVNENLPGTAGTTPYPAVRVDFPAPIVVSGMETFTLKAVGISGPGAMFWEVAGIGNIPCPDAEVTNENNIASPTMRTSACGLKVIDAGGGVVGTNYCTANPNSTGAPASMSATGSAVVMNNDLVLEADGLPTNSFGFFLTSTTQGFVANPGGSQGNLCLGGAIGRYVGPGQIQNSMGTGGIQLAVDNTQTPTPTGLVPIMAGETWNFTAWFRDTDGAGGATSNFADGLEIRFL